MKPIALLLLILFVPTFLLSQGKINKDLMVKDLEDLELQLKKLHPAINIENAGIIELEFKKLKEQLPVESTRIDFFELISSILNKINCSHTSIYPRKLKMYDQKGYFPLVLDEIEKRIIVSNHYIYNNGLDTIKRGSKIVSIDGQPIDSVLSNLVNFHGGSDEINENIERKFALKNFATRYKQLFGSKTQYRVEFKNEYITINSIHRKELNRNIEIIELEINNEKSLALLKLNSFLGYDKYGILYGTKLKKVFKELRKKSIENLIIDVRDNSGGAYLNMKRLLSYLINSKFKILKEVKLRKSTYRNLGLLKFAIMLRNPKRQGEDILLAQLCKEVKPKKRNSFKGKLIVLINEKSASATSIFGSIIKSEARGTLVGAKSGGGYHFTYGGYFTEIALESGINLRIPLFTLLQNVKGEKQKKGTNLFPDIEIQQDYQSYLQGVDLQLEKGYELLNIQK